MTSPTASDVLDVARNVTLDRLVARLRAQDTVKHDIVLSSKEITSDDGRLIVFDGWQRIDADGVTPTDLVLAPTAHAIGQIAEATGIPVRYARRMLQECPRLYDLNVNHWLHSDDRQFLVRSFVTDAPTVAAEDPVGGRRPTTHGVVRGFLSDRYRAIDNLDVLFSVLGAIRDLPDDADVTVTGADLTEQSMFLRIEAPGIAIAAEPLLARYRSPFSGRSGADLPLVHAGFVVRNGEVGGAALTITPRIVVKVCSNGLTLDVGQREDAFREIHLGSRLESGIVRWSEDTTRHALDLMRAKMRDVVTTYLDRDYVAEVIDRLTPLAEAPGTLTGDRLTDVTRRFGMTETEQDAILEHFIRGGDTSAFGWAQAATSYAQVVDNPERADELERNAVALAGAVAQAVR